MSTKDKPATEHQSDSASSDDPSNSLPNPSTWPHQPICFQADEATKVIGSEPGQPLPLGKPVEFETDPFRGKILLRLKSVPPVPDSGDPEAEHHKAYFDGKQRLFQVVLQGRFKESGLKMSDVFVGDAYQKPFKGVPRGAVMKIVQKFMQTVSPGMIFDVVSDKPKVLTCIGLCQTLSIDLPGEEPDITVLDSVKENTSLLGEEFVSASQRRKRLSKPKHSSKFTFDTEYIYTFHFYDHTMDFGTYHQHMMGGKIEMTKMLNGQPLALCAMTKDQRVLYRFPIWHERLLETMKEDSENKI